MHFLSVIVFLLIRVFNLKVKRQTSDCKDKTKMSKRIILLTSAIGNFQISFDFAV